MAEPRRNEDRVNYRVKKSNSEKPPLIDRRVWVELREKNVFVDGTLLTESGGEIPVHRSIMAVNSPYFRSVFTNTLGNSDCSTFRTLVPSVAYHMLMLVVHYAYTGETLITEDNAAELLRTADQLMMTGMIKDCSEFIESKMCPENCIGFNKFANDFFLKDLMEATHKYIMMNFPQIAEKSEEFLDLSLNEVVAILDSEELNVNNEKIVFEACLKWVEKDEENRKKHIVDLLKCVRLGLLSSNYFMETVKKHKYVQNNEECKQIIIETVKFLCDLQEITQRTEAVPTPFLARPRIPHDVLFAVGGWSGGAPTNLIETYDTRADRWVRLEEVDPSGPRAYHRCITVGFSIYVIGGFDGVRHFNSCRRFDVLNKTWHEISPMVTKRCYVSAAVLNDLIYAIGGYDGQHRVNTVERYNIPENQWSPIAPMNAQRSDACATTLNGRIYITGGFNGAECLSSCEYYDPETMQWALTSPMQSRRSGVSCIGHSGYLFVLGGFNGIHRLQSGEKYNPGTDQWTTIENMFSPRSNFAIEVIDNLIFAIGGFNGATTISQVECYDETSDEWLEATDMSAFRSALAACVVRNVPNVREYIHQHRENLMEEKRQRLLDIQNQQRAERAQNRRRQLNEEDDEFDEEDDDEEDDEDDDDEIIVEDDEEELEEGNEEHAEDEIEEEEEEF